MGTCANCRHWTPHAGSPTGMVCGTITSTRSGANTPALMLDRVADNEAQEPLRMATAKDFGCVLHDTGARG